MTEAAPITNDFAADERWADERGLNAQLNDQLYASRHAYRVVEERNKQLQEEVRRLRLVKRVFITNVKGTFLGMSESEEASKRR